MQRDLKDSKTFKEIQISSKRFDGIQRYWWRSNKITRDSKRFEEILIIKKKSKRLKAFKEIPRIQKNS